MDLGVASFVTQNIIGDIIEYVKRYIEYLTRDATVASKILRDMRYIKTHYRNIVTLEKGYEHNIIKRLGIKVYGSLNKYYLAVHRYEAEFYSEIK